MRANLTDTTNPNAVTKKFWSYVKHSSNSSRIPDPVFRNNNSRKIQLDWQNFLIISFMINFRQKVTIQLMWIFQVKILSTLSLTKTR